MVDDFPPGSLVLLIKSNLFVLLIKNIGQLDILRVKTVLKAKDYS